MSITAHSRTGGDTGTIGRLPMLVPPLAALLYPFSLEGFNTSVTHIVVSAASSLSWLSAAGCLTLAFATPLIAILAAMSFSEIGRPTVAQLHAKHVALLAVAAPTLFTFVGVVLTMLHDPMPDTWLWVACWAIALATATALRQRRAGGGRAPTRSGTAARRPRRVGARPRYDLPGAPHRQPLDVPRGRRDVRCGDESVPPRVPQRAFCSRWWSRSSSSRLALGSSSFGG